MDSDSYVSLAECNFEALVDEQHAGTKCADCFDTMEQCDLDFVSHGAHHNSGCIECSRSGRYCHIPVSDEMWIQRGLDTATQGIRRCLNCVVNGTSCTFPGGQRPNPCHSCIRKRSGVCKLPPQLLTYSLPQNHTDNSDDFALLPEDLGPVNFDLPCEDVDITDDGIPIENSNSPYGTYTVLVTPGDSDQEVGIFNTVNECGLEHSLELQSNTHGSPRQSEFSAATMAADLISDLTPFPMADSPITDFDDGFIGDFMAENQAGSMSEQQYD